jgi:hypothetical protein
MPNPPLQTFRAVEPANYGFGAAANISSQPFVLYHVRGEEVATSTTVTTLPTIATYTHSLNPVRFQPWLARNLATHYPVMVPNAYDRVLIFPMWVVDTRSGVNGDGTTVPVTFTVAAPGDSYVAPIVMPFGLLPQSRGYGNKGSDLNRRLPGDLIKLLNPQSPTPETLQSDGLWQVLPPYASNFAYSNGLAVAAGTYAAPVATPRSTESGTVGVGAPYQLPPDLAIGFSATAVAVSNTVSQYASTTNSSSSVFCGAGVEFSTLGCEELVVCPVAPPVNFPAVTTNVCAVVPQAEPAVPATNGASALNFFLMGVFQG